MKKLRVKNAGRGLAVSALGLLLGLSPARAQGPAGTLFKPARPHYQVQQALEVESVPFVFFSQGYHVAVGYRYERFRVRLSTIDAGTFSSEPSQPEAFRRVEGPGSLGLFVGYNAWKNLDVYGILERQNFRVSQQATGERARLPTATYGLGVGYQFFLGRTFYVQPGVHLYTRAEKAHTFGNGAAYSLATAEVLPVVRLGIRLWRQPQEGR